MTQTGERRDAVTVAMELAAQQGWRHTSMGDVAAAAGLTLAELYASYPSRAALLDALSRRADARMLEAAQDEAGQGTVRERLFAVIMARLDVLAPHKEGLRRVLGEIGGDPEGALASACAVRRSLNWMLELAGVETAGPLGALRRAGLGAIWFDVLRIWLRDDNPDQSTTMAALDRRLARAERWAGRWRRGGAEPGPVAAPSPDAT